MKFPIIVLIFVTVFIEMMSAQPRCPRCPQGTCPANCFGAVNVGTNCTTAPPRKMWYYEPSSRICRPMAHLGCGGNTNRWCTLFECTLRCALALA